MTPESSKLFAIGTTYELTRPGGTKRTKQGEEARRLDVRSAAG